MTVNDWHPRPRVVPVVEVPYQPEPAPSDRVTPVLVPEEVVEQRIRERRRQVVWAWCDEYGSEAVLQLVHDWRRRNGSGQ